MPKCFILDTYYDEFLRGYKVNPAGTYQSELNALLAESFGTSSFYSENLAKYGWECEDIIANSAFLQDKWMLEHGHSAGAYSLKQVALRQIEAFKPDVILLQDVSFFDAATLKELRENYLLAFQCSCPMPPVENLQCMDVGWTSFPHYVARFKALGIPRVEYMPLAFEPRMLDECAQSKRDMDSCFVGGLGRQSHWRYGTDNIETVARQFPSSFHWFGYGLENISPLSTLRGAWRGPAWGKDMYRLYGRSKIVITRHGEVAEGFTNNLRCFEAAGMGAMLMTEASPNLDDLFPRGTVVPYSSADELCDNIAFYLEHEEDRAMIAAAGQAHTLENHTYAARMKQVSAVLTECLEAKQMTR